MKVNHTQPQSPVAAPPKQPFKQLLAEARGPAARTPKGPPVALASSATRPVTNLPKTSLPKTSATPSVVVNQARATRQVARQHVDAEADRLATVRAGHHEATAQREVKATEALASPPERVDARVLSLILKELESAFDRDPPHVERAANCDGKPGQPFRADATPAPATPAPAPARAEQAVALIERIETFVRSARPALALTLNNSLGARVEIERLGPGRIALKLVGQRGPPSADAVSRIREELLARGLKVGALSVA